MPNAHDDDVWSGDPDGEEPPQAPGSEWHPLKTLGAVLLILLFGTPVAMVASVFASGFAIITLRNHGHHNDYEGLGPGMIAIFGVAPGFPLVFLLCLGVVAVRNRERDAAQRNDLSTAFAMALVIAIVGAFVAGMCVQL